MTNHKVLKVSDILQFLTREEIPYVFEGDENNKIEGYCPLNNLKHGCLTWVRHIESLDVFALNTVRDMTLVAPEGDNISGAKFSVIYTDNAHRTFFRILSHFYSEEDPENRVSGIASTAVVETTSVGSDVFVGHHTFIGPNVDIGNHVQILNNVTIEGRVIIGDYTVIESGTTIGACGFGHYRDEDGNPVCVPHLGGVIIGKHCKIGANNAISRGCLSDTVIEDYVKTDNLVHIAHNDHIKSRAMFAACAEVSGSVTIGEDAWIAPNTSVNNGIELGDRCFTGLGAAVTKSQPGFKIVAGVPAKVIRDRTDNDQ